MIYLLVGEDDFSKQNFIKELYKPGVEVQSRDVERLPSAEELSSNDLFGSKKLWILRNCVDALERDTWLTKVSASPHIILLVEEKLDRRKTATKAWLTDKRLTLKEFFVPESAELSKWVTDHAQSLGLSWTQDLSTHLLDRLGFVDTGRFGEGTKPDLWLIHHELEKIKTYSADEPPTKETINNLVPQNAEAHVFSILDALAAKQSRDVTNLLSNYFSGQDGTDEKAKAIALTAVLAEQFRSILLVLAASVERVSDQKLLADTGWKSGRLFVVRKNASRFAPAKVKDLLQKLSFLDTELKSSSTPPRVLLDLILAPLLIN